MGLTDRSRAQQLQQRQSLNQAKAARLAPQFDISNLSRAEQAELQALEKALAAAEVKYSHWQQEEEMAYHTRDHIAHREFQAMRMKCMGEIELINRRINELTDKATK